MRLLFFLDSFHQIRYVTRMKAKKYYSLPRGGTTTSIRRYSKEWTELYKRLETHFPDLKIIGFDPGFSFSYGARSIDLPASFVIELLEKLG